MIKLVIVESPYSGDIQVNTDYAGAAVLDCIARGETPFASHLFYPQVLDEDDEGQRDCGIRLGYEVGKAFLWAAEFEKKHRALGPQITTLVAFYVDLGWSHGMEAALEEYTALGAKCEIRHQNTTREIDTPPSSAA